jgi:hypothetical protein
MFWAIPCHTTATRVGAVGDTSIRKPHQRRASNCRDLIFVAICRTLSWLSSLADERQILHTKNPSVPRQRATNDIGLAATSTGYTHKDA